LMLRPAVLNHSELCLEPTYLFSNHTCNAKTNWTSVFLFLDHHLSACTSWTQTASTLQHAAVVACSWSFRNTKKKKQPESRVRNLYMSQSELQTRSTCYVSTSTI
jgi:hypothetical protein